MIISEQWWKKYEEKYGKLMYTISKKLGGDPMITSIEDNYNELCIAALDSVKSFYNQRGQTNKDIDSYLTSKAFDKYTKTVLWNRKAKNGLEVTKNLGVTNASSISQISFGDDSDEFSLEIEDKSDYFCDVDIQDLLNYKEFNNGIESEELREILRHIISGGDCILDNGKLSIRKLAHQFGLQYHVATKRVEKLKLFLSKEIKNEN